MRPNLACFFQRQVATINGSRAGKKGIMAMSTKKQSSAPQDKKKSEVEIHDLKPTRDPKGGAGRSSTENKNRPTKTGEVDFMKDLG
jgi:hypothetical protein